MAQASLSGQKATSSLYWGVYGIPSALFLWLFSKDFLERSLYNDGLWYAILSRNLARGEGSLWAPKLTDTIFPQFHEHPPLGFIVQAPFFSLLGEGWLTERVYALSVMLVTVFLLRALWKQAGGSPGLFWLPLSFWLFNEVNYHFYPSNILEPLLSLWSLLAVWMAWKSLDQPSGLRAQVFTVGAGLFVLLGLLTKGPVGLFPIAFFGIHWLVFRQHSMQQVVRATMVMLSVPVVGLLGLYLGWPDAREGLQAYWETQVQASLARTRLDRHHRNNRLYLMGRLVLVMAPVLAVSLLAYLSSAAKRPKLPTVTMLLFGIGLSASLPMVISPKQSYYYLLPCLPYFALGLALWASHTRPRLFPGRWPSFTPLVFNVLVVVLNLAGLVRAAGFYGDINRRDAETYPDLQQVAAVVHPHQTLGSATYDPYVVGYLGRLYDINIDTTHKFSYPYLLTDECQLDSVIFDSLQWQPLNLDTDFYLLMRKR